MLSVVGALTLAFEPSARHSIPRTATLCSTPPTLCSSSRAASPVAKAPEFLFELSEDRSSIRFGCSQDTLTVVRPELGGSLQDFIGSSADAIVLASWDQGQVQRIADTEPAEFLINVEEFDFVALKFAVELKARCDVVRSKTAVTATLDSLGFRLLGPGLESIENAIDVKVSGKLTPTPPDSRMCALSGKVAFEASGEVPPVLRAAPDPALRAAARAMSEALIGAASERFSQKVPAQYKKWAAAQKQRA